MLYDEHDLSIYNFNSIINYIQNNIAQIFLLIVVFLTIYAVDYISNANAMIMAPISIITGQPQFQTLTLSNKILKKHKQPKK